MAISQFSVNLNGLITGDMVTVGGSGSYTQKNVGSNLAYSVLTSSLGGTDASNYYLLGGNQITGNNGVITAKSLTVSGITASNKVYDGNQSATVNVNTATQTGLVSGDQIYVAATGLFDTKNAGASKTVLLTSSYSGADVSNYSITDQTFTTASITPKQLVITGTVAQDKTYDGTPVASVTPGVLTGLVGAETVGASASGTFDSKDAGARSATAVYQLSNGSNGGLATNYYLDNTSGHSANITRAHLTVVADDKTRFFGKENPPLTVTVVGFVNGESATTAQGYAGSGLASTTADTATPIGTANITAAQGTLSALNYDFPNLVDATLTITPLPSLVPPPPKSEPQVLPTPASDPPEIQLLAASDANKQVVIRLIAVPTSKHAGQVIVLIPQAIVRKGEGFKFKLPTEIGASETTAAHLKISATTGSVWPAWLRYISRSGLFEVLSLPSRALPFEFTVEANGLQTKVLITESDQ
jgi:hypothetical protein